MMLDGALLAKDMRLGIALSGGSDSTALLMLAAEHLGAGNLAAITVDHGLRRAAADEAKQAKALCETLGIPHEIVTLQIQDGADLQARARSARYNALADWALRGQLTAVALGHTQNDVAETFLMRLARGSGVDGLAQMANRFSCAGVTFLRPLLNAKREDLRAYLRARDISWSDDPSNRDTRFTRVQMREAQAQMDALGLSTQRLAQTAQWMSRAAEVLDQAADDWIAKHAIAEHGDAVLDPAALRAAPKETALRVLARILCAISQNPYRPRLNALEELLNSDSANTLHGCLSYTHKGKLRITQELSAITPENNRWTLEGPFLAGHTIAPLGEKGLSQCDNWRETALLPRRSLLASPAVWNGKTVIAAPLAKPDSKWRAAVQDPLHLAK